MKRKLICGLLCLLLLFGSLALEAFAAELDSADVDWGLTLRVDEITPTGMTVVIIQSGGSCEGDLEYGSSYHLERLEEDGWKRVSYVLDDFGWTMVAYGVPKESIFRMEENWEMIYGALPNGHYRFVKEFTDFRGAGDYDDADFFAEFVIADAHTCVSEDGDLLCDICLGIAAHDCIDSNGDAECDICGKKISDRDVYRVIGDADWLGNWSLGSNLGLMTQTEPGIYQATFRDVSVGSYSIKIIKNDDWSEVWGDHDEYFSFTVDRKMDITITFTLKNGEGVIEVIGPTVDGLGEQEDKETSPGSADQSVGMLIVLFAICSASVLFLLNKRRDAQ